jgi:hypothetical protein
VNLNTGKDEAIWKWIGNKKFSLKSVYEFLTRDEYGPSYRKFWKAKIPEKIKMFMWLVAQKSI